jgi:hypothetical protein
VRTLGEMGGAREPPVAAGCVGGRVSVASPSATKPKPKRHNWPTCRRFRPKQQAKRPQSPVYPPIRAASARHNAVSRTQTTHSTPPPTVNNVTTSRPADQPTSRPAYRSTDRQRRQASRQRRADRPADQPTSRPADQPTSDQPTAPSRGLHCDFSVILPPGIVRLSRDENTTSRQHRRAHQTNTEPTATSRPRPADQPTSRPADQPTSRPADRGQPPSLQRRA